MAANDHPIGIRFSPTQRAALDAMATQRQTTLTDVVRDAALQGIAEEDARRVRTHLLQLVTLLELYDATPDRQDLLRAPLRQWLRASMARLAAFDAQLTEEEGQP